MTNSKYIDNLAVKYWKELPLGKEETKQRKVKLEDVTLNIIKNKNGIQIKFYNGDSFNDYNLLDVWDYYYDEPLLKKVDEIRFLYDEIDKIRTNFWNLTRYWSSEEAEEYRQEMEDDVIKIESKIQILEERNKKEKE